MATAQSINLVQQIYIAYYQRPADPAGLRFWADRLDQSGGDLTQIINAFATSAESTALYGAINAGTIGAVIDGIYQALFNRPADASGKQFYIDGFIAGRFTAGTIALNVLQGATGSDDVTILNKLTVANRFTAAVDGRPLDDANFGQGGNPAATYAADDLADAKTYLSQVTQDPATVPSESSVLNFVANNVANAGDDILDTIAQGQAFTLTPLADVGAAFLGGQGNDVYSGLASDLQPGDQLDGAGGVNTLNITGARLTDFFGNSAFQQAQNAGIAGILADQQLEGVRNVQVIKQASGVNTTLGANAVRAGVNQLDLGGQLGQLGVAQAVDLTTFASGITVNGTQYSEFVAVDLNTAGAKTLNLGGDAGTGFFEGPFLNFDTVNVTALTGAPAGATQVNFVSGNVGNGNSAGANNTVTLVNAAGNVTVNDEGTVLIGSVNNQFNVIGLNATTLALDPAQNRGNFQTVVLGTSGADAQNQGNFNGNVYINAGQGNDTLTAFAGVGQRHFLVGGDGNDTLNITTDIDVAREQIGTVVVLAGNNDDAAVVGNTHLGATNIILGAGNDSVTFTTFVDNGLGDVNGMQLHDNAPNGEVDTLSGGDGTDTLIATVDALNSVITPASAAVRTVSGFEVLTVSDAEGLGALGGLDLILSDVQTGLGTVNLATSTPATDAINDSDITFDAGLAGTVNLRDNLGGAGISLIVRSAGTGTTDQVTINNAMPADVDGLGQNAYSGSNILSGGVETLNISTNAAGTPVTQTLNAVSVNNSLLNPLTSFNGTVNFTGSNTLTVGTTSARNVNASGLTGTAALTTTLVTVAAPVGSVNTFVGSANGDTITLGSAAAINLDLGAGNDTLFVPGLINGTEPGATAGLITQLASGASNLQGGNGTDTLDTTVETAATLSVANPFNANHGGFEILSIHDHVEGDQLIRLDNLGVSTVISDGFDPAAVAGSTITLQNLDSGDTLRLTGGSALDELNTHEVIILNSGVGLNDVLNLELANNANVLNYGTVRVVNTETVNINTTGTAALVAAQSVISLADTGAPTFRLTTLNVSGNNGLIIDGANSALSSVTTFDASGVVGDAANDTAAGLGVFFVGQAATAMTLTGGAGNDTLGGSQSANTNDTINLGTGGADQVVIATDLVFVVDAGPPPVEVLDATPGGVDTVNGFTGGLAGGANVDVLAFNDQTLLLGEVSVLPVDYNGATAGIFFNATASNTVDLTIPLGVNELYFITNGAATLEATALNVKGAGGATAQAGEILVEDGASAYIVQAASTSATSFNVYHVTDALDGLGNPAIELVATVNMSNTVGDLTLSNFAPFAI